MHSERVLLFTDAVDSTQLTEQLGDAAASALWAEHEHVTRVLLRTWNGREIDKSDGFLLLFDEVDLAVGFALDLHAALARLDPPLAVRAGIHRGSMITRENSEADIALGAKPLELDGIARAVAARIMTLARGGQTLLSASARASLRDSAWQVLSHGHWRMKGVAMPMEIFEVGDGVLPLLPPPDSAKSYRVVAVDDGWQPVANLRNNLPAQRDPFVGRGEALASLAARYDAGARLVSVLGIGGIGKTRLVLRYAQQWLGNYPGGAWFCDLSSARSLDGVVHAVAQGLDVPLGKADPVQQLGAAIAGRESCLVVLDNFEQVVRHAEATLGEWLDSAPDARFLVTSREVLGIAGEEAFVLAPMGNQEAVRLFETRARAVDDRTDTMPAVRSDLETLVDLLDRLPLAIELAAARVRVMAPAAMLHRMGERFKLLASSGRRHDRQATLRAALDWSWDLLSTAEQSAMVQLSVFSGGFSLEAAEAVVDLTDTTDARWVTDVVQGLVEKSLIGRVGSERFGFLRTVLDYTIERAALVGRNSAAETAAAAAARRHWQFFGARSEQEAVADRCADAENLLSACERAADQDVPAATQALEKVWAVLRMTGPFRAVLPLLESIERSGTADARQQLSLDWVAAGALHQIGDLGGALTRATAGLRNAHEQRDRGVLGRMHLTMADILRSLGRARESETHALQALGCAKDDNDPLGQLKALNSLGALHYADGHNERALGCFEAALELARRTGHQRWIGGVLGNLASLRYAQGRWQEALDQFLEAVQLARAVGDRQWEGNNRSNLGLLHFELGQLPAAIEELLGALQIARDIGHARLERLVLCNLGIVLEAQGNTAEALKAYDSAVALCRTFKDRRSEGQFRGYRGLLLARLGRVPLSALDLREALDLLTTEGDRPGLALVASQTALACMLEGRRGEAERQLKHAEQIIEQLEIEPSPDWRRVLGEVRGRLANALVQ